jgi:site-specific DNA-methyltransferase (adenine-specific)
MDKVRRRDYVQAAIDLGVPLPGRSVTDWTDEDHAPGDKWWSTFKASLPAETWAAIERRVVGTAVTGQTGWFVSGKGAITAPATDAARQWAGWGTALKPAHEPIVLARKPLVGTVAANVLAHGTGAINVDKCRIGTDGGGQNGTNGTKDRTQWRMGAIPAAETPIGRWPSNLAHDGSDEVLEAFAKFGSSTSPSKPVRQGGKNTQGFNVGGGSGPDREGFGVGYADTGTAARFFFCAKASRSERNAGCEEMAEKPLLWSSGAQNPGSFQAEGTKRSAQNNHPTVKPLALMRWLCRLITPPGGTVLDPFLGSGSTAIAADQEGFNCIGIELEAEYMAIARARITADAPLLTEVA